MWACLLFRERFPSGSGTSPTPGWPRSPVRAANTDSPQIPARPNPSESHRTTVPRPLQTGRGGAETGSHGGHRPRVLQRVTVPALVWRQTGSRKRGRRWERTGGRGRWSWSVAAPGERDGAGGARRASHKQIQTNKQLKEGKPKDKVQSTWLGCKTSATEMCLIFYVTIAELKRGGGAQNLSSGSQRTSSAFLSTSDWSRTAAEGRLCCDWQIIIATLSQWTPAHLKNMNMKVRKKLYKEESKLR